MTKLAVLLTEGFADWECAHLMATGRSYFGFEIAVVTPGGKMVTSSGGLRVQSDLALEALDPSAFDALVVCGGDIWTSPEAPDPAPQLRAFVAQGKLIAGICAATLALARAGVLDSVAHTSNAADFIAGSGYGGQAHYRDTPAAVRDGLVVTAPGTAPVTYMAEIFGALGYGGEELDYYLGLLAAEHGANKAA